MDMDMDHKFAVSRQSTLARVSYYSEMVVFNRLLTDVMGGTWEMC